MIYVINLKIFLSSPTPWRVSGGILRCPRSSWWESSCYSFQDASPIGTLFLKRPPPRLSLQRKNLLSSAGRNRKRSCRRNLVNRHRRHLRLLPHPLYKSRLQPSWISPSAMGPLTTLTLRSYPVIDFRNNWVSTSRS